jgi:outer membrane protein W
MKKLILSLLIVALAINLNAQEKGKIRVGLNMGLGFPSLGVGIDGDLDIRYNVMDNLNFGVKFGAASLAKDMKRQFDNTTLATACAITSTLFTGDYYFNKPNSHFATFLGGGFGRYSIANVQISSDDDKQDISNMNPDISKKVGGLLRCGFESRHFRMAMEYYIIPSSNLVDLDKNLIGTTENSFLNFTIGFYFGGGRWRKSTLPVE